MDRLARDPDDDPPTGPAERARLKAFGLRIRLLRTAHGWSQQQLGEHAGMDRTFVGQIERGKRGMNILRLWPLAEALKMPISDLFTDERGFPI